MRSFSVRPFRPGHRPVTLVSILAALILGYLVAPRVGPGPQLAPAIDVDLAALRAAIEREYPLLARADAADRERVDALRAWTHTRVDSSSKARLLDELPGFGFERRTAPELFEAFGLDKGGVWCGGNASTLVKLFRAFGYDAHAVDSGAPGVMTHVVAIVKIRHGRRWIWSVQDALFDITYVDDAGDPLDYFELLDRLARREHDSIHTAGERAPHPRLILGPDDPIVEHAWALGSDVPLAVHEDGTRVFAWNLTLERFERRFGARIADYLRSSGEPAEIVYLLRRPIQMWGGDATQAASLLERAKAVANRGVPALAATPRARANPAERLAKAREVR